MALRRPFGPRADQPPPPAGLCLAEQRARHIAVTRAERVKAHGARKGMMTRPQLTLRRGVPAAAAGAARAGVRSAPARLGAQLHLQLAEVLPPQQADEGAR